jgi:predicted lipase
LFDQAVKVISLAFQALKNRNKVSCYTYGAPPVGVAEFEYVENNDEIVRIVNHGDIVPRAMKAGAGLVLFGLLILQILKQIWKSKAGEYF